MYDTFIKNLQRLLVFSFWKGAMYTCVVLKLVEWEIGMSFQTFVSIFNSAFPDLKEKHKSVYAWERYFRHIAEVKLCIPRNHTDSISVFVELAYRDSLEGSDERDKFEACMLCILDLAVEADTPGEWDKPSIDVFKNMITNGHFDAYLLYMEIRKGYSKA